MSPKVKTNNTGKEIHCCDGAGFEDPDGPEAVGVDPAGPGAGWADPDGIDVGAADPGCAGAE